MDKKFHSEFSKDEGFILVIPTNEKPVKIVHDTYKIVASTDNPMEYTLSRRTTVGEMAANMDMTVEEFMKWLDNGN